MAQRVVIPGFRKIETSGGGEGTGNYNDLQNKPSINNVPLVGNLRTVDLKLTDPTLTEEGIPAEAKEVGIRLEKHSTSLNAVKKEAMVNLLKPTLETTTQNGVTCTNNGDGTYTLSGTNNNAGQSYFKLTGSFVLNNDCILTGCVGGDPNSFGLGVFDGTVTHEETDGSIPLSAGTYPESYIYVRVGITVSDNTIIKPMVTTNLDATYDDFVPYTGDTGKINSDVAALLKRIEALESRTNKTDTTVAE